MIQRAGRPQPGTKPPEEDAPERERQVGELRDPAPDRMTEQVPVELEAPQPQLLGQIEALLFVANEPLPARRIADLLGEEASQVRAALGALRSRHGGDGSGVRLAEIAGGWRLLTRPEHADAIAALAGKRAPDRLSPAALETLAIIAYKQPVGRAEIERIRGVGVGPILRHLLEIDLIKVAGREEGLGRALLYGTTRAFLDRFGLKSVKDLPASLEL
jgi:segregation and condensation protein B